MFSRLAYLGTSILGWPNWEDQNRTDPQDDHLKVRVHATLQSAEPSLSWKITVNVNGCDSPRSLSLQALADVIDKNELRWYLEQYAQNDPFALTRAREVEPSIKRYAKTLAGQLELQPILASALESSIGRGDVRHVIEIEVSEDALDQGSTSSTVHQVHWETLEEVSQWLDNYRVIVRRITAPTGDENQSSQSTTTIQSASDSTSTLNLLLVVARDLSKAPSSYQDVNPSLASELLARISETVTQASHRMKLSMEIVRPGTIEALEKHLEQASNERGLGLFQIVHFDLHGAVRKSRGTKTAFLKFAAPSSDSTVLVPASKVAKLLRRHQVPFAVLNSCESARASDGDDANIAKTFQHEGLQSVLAMSFKVSGHAAEIFLRSFYGGLILEGLTFSQASYKAREALRSDPLRPCRFGLERPVLDWFVPVCYIRDKDVALVQHHCHSLVGRKPKSKVSPTGKCSAQSTRVKQSRLFGRDFDLLRFEKLLIKKRSVYLHGVFAVGKTAFLKHAWSIWMNTSFVDAIVYIDMADAEFEQPGQITRAILQQLQPTGRKNNDSKFGFWQSKTELPKEDGVAIELVKELAQQSRLVIVFDRLHDAFSRLESDFVRRRSRQSVAASLNAFLAKMTESSSKARCEDSPYLVFTGRKDFKWFRDHVDIDIDMAVFELEELQVSDSIDLAQALLNDTSTENIESATSNLDQLECVVDLLQNNPGAMCEVLPHMQEHRIPLHQRHDFLRSVPLVRCLDTTTGKSSHLSLTAEIMHICCNLRDELFASLIILGLYWHEAPHVAILAEQFLALGLCTDVKDVDLAVDIASEAGFLATSSDGSQVVWIHPQFTIVLRAVALMVVTNSHLQHGAQITVQENADTNFAGELPMAVKAARLVCSFLPQVCAKMSAILKEINVSGIRETFFNTLDLQWRWKTIVAAASGIHVKDMPRFYLRGLLNTLTCIDAMEYWVRDVDMSEWPQVLLIRLSAHMKVIGTTVQKRLCVGEYERLMRTYVSRHGYAVDSRNLYVALNLANYLAWSHIAGGLSDIKSKSPEAALHLAEEILKSSERKCGSITSGFVLYEKAYVFRLGAILKMKQTRFQEGIDAWKQFMKLDDLWTEYIQEQSKVPDRDQDESSDLDALQELVIGCEARDKKQAAEMHQRLSSLQTWSVEKAYAESRKEVLNILEALAMKDVTLGSTKWIETVTSALTDFTPAFKNVEDIQAGVGLRGMEDDSRAWPENSDLAALIAKRDDRSQILHDLEIAKDSGDLVKAAGFHGELVRSAFLSADFEDALNHTTAAIELYGKESQFESSLAEVKPTHLFLSGQNSFWQAVHSDPSTLTPERLSQVVPAIDQMIEALKLNNSPPEAIEDSEVRRQIWCAEAENGFQKIIPMLKQLGADKNKETAKAQYSKFFEDFLKSDPGPKEVAEISAQSTQIMRIQKQLGEMNTTRDTKDMLRALTLVDELEKLSTTSVGRLMVEMADYQGYCEAMQWKYDSFLADERWEEAMEAENYENALEQVETLVRLKETGEHAGYSATHKSLDEMFADTERSLWNQMYTTASKTTGPSRERIELWDKLLDKYNQNRFSHIKSAEFVACVRKTMLNLNFDQAVCSYNEGLYGESVKHCNKWLDIAGALDGAKYEIHGLDLVTELKEDAEILYHHNEYVRAEMRNDFQHALQHVDQVEKLCKRLRKQGPRIEREHPRPTIEQEQLDTVRFDLSFKLEIMKRFPPAQARDLIELRRRAQGAVPQLV